ncbi:glycosyltransferase family 4 protein [Candidatus Uabimicrobium sp. HlEnr_7]|uniref:glycosyltransferase family 4 protein n=1 Tax=Candidatus Uabimicrobium helgolandensis TaxID=3095367 RepID=UPI00355819EE
MTSSSKTPSIILMYHFFYPDDVVSARHFTQLAEGLYYKGWKVRVLTTNRYCRYSHKLITPKRELHNGIEIIRVYRPPFNQANNYLRVLNSIYVLVAWSIRLLTMKRSDVIVVGTDPQFAALIFPFLRLFCRGKTLVHWCFDLYPEAIVADKKGKITYLAALIAKCFMYFSYKFVDIMVDIGSCMREILKKYNNKITYSTLVPWALVEPETIELPDQDTRTNLFGSDAKLTILYSGNMGKAHEFTRLITLARHLRDCSDDIVFCFACRGNRYEELVKEINEQDTNIRFAGFAKESELSKRLGCADIHLVSLKDEWAGIVVPSKFFGSIAVGKPIIFNGPENSAIGKWIIEHNVGWVLTDNNIQKIADKLIQLKEDSEQIKQYAQKAQQVYKTHFSQKSVIQQWDTLLRGKIK